MWGSGRPSLAYNEVAIGSNPIHPTFHKYGTENFNMPTFSVPAGCRQAMTDLHKAHTDRYSRITHKINQMKVNQKEDHRLIAAFMDTHNVLHGAVEKALKSSDAEMPSTVRDSLEAASTHASDIRTSLIKGHRGAGIGRASVAGKPVGPKLAGKRVDPQTHLLKVIDDIRQRFPEKSTESR